MLKPSSLPPPAPARSALFGVMCIHITHMCFASNTLHIYALQGEQPTNVTSLGKGIDASAINAYQAIAAIAMLNDDRLPRLSIEAAAKK